MKDMMKKLASKLTLIAEEDREVVIENDLAEEWCSKLYLFVGKLQTSKDYNLEALKGTMKNIWRPRARVKACDFDEGRVLFTFESKRGRDTVLKGGPWSFNKCLLALAASDGLSDLHNISLASHDFWVQARGLSSAFMNPVIEKIVENSVGKYLATDKSLNGDYLGDYLLIRVAVDIHKTLPRGVKLRLPGEREFTWVNLMYERLPNYYHVCGLIDHVDKK